MKLRDPFVRLPLQFDVERLSGEIAALAEDAWKPRVRQSQDQRELPLVSVDGDPDGETRFGPMRPTAHLARCPYLVQVLASLDAVLGRVRLLKSNDGYGIQREADVSYYGATHMSVHVPVAIHPGARFVCDGIEVRMGAGECWVVDTWREHRLVSDQGGERIHLVADTVGSRALRSLFDKGCSPQRTPPDWRPQFITLAPEPAHLHFESINAPVIMTPWELREHIGLLLAEARPHPKLPVVREALDRFLGTWLALWARHGPDADDRGAYRKALESLEHFMRREASELQLDNRATFLQAMRNLVLERAVSDEAPARDRTS